MKRILLMSLGSRGDMEPFLALGQTLIKNGHQVGFCMPEQFQSLAQTVASDFYPQDKSFLDLVHGPDIRKIIGQVGSKWSRLWTLLRLMKKTKTVQEQMILDQEAAVKAFLPDKIIFHIKCIYPVIWGLHFRKKVAMLSPIPGVLHPIDNIPHVAFGRPRFPFWNRMTYALALYALVNKSILGYGKSFLKKYNIHLSSRQLKAFYLQQLAVTYTVSPQLFERPAAWPPQAQCNPFLLRESKRNYTPPDDLQHFLKTYPNPVYVGFGSMVNAQPKTIAADVIAVCERLHQPLILNASWGGLEPPDSLPEWAFVVADVPFDYLFPKVAVVIHHGGAGTTHAALAHQTPQAIIPHIADQYFWNRQIQSKGLGCYGFPIKKWSQKRFETLLQKLLSFSLNEPIIDIKKNNPTL